MSEYVDYSYTITQPAARQEIAASFSSGFRDFLSWSTSTWLSAEERETKLQQAYQKNLLLHSSNTLASGGTSIEQVSCVANINAMLHALHETPDLLAHLQLVQKAAWDSLQGDLRPLVSTPLTHLGHEERNRQAERLQGQLRQLVTESHKALAEVEVGFSIKVLNRTLTALGYQVSQGKSSLRAIKGPTCLWGEVTPKAGIKLDTSGLSGLQCLKQLQELEQALEKQGLKLKRRRSTTHGRPEGGELAQKLSSCFNVTEVQDTFCQGASPSLRKAKKRLPQRLKVKG